MTRQRKRVTGTMYPLIYHLPFLVLEADPAARALPNLLWLTRKSFVSVTQLTRVPHLGASTTQSLSHFVCFVYFIWGKIAVLDSSWYNVCCRGFRLNSSRFWSGGHLCWCAPPTQVDGDEETVNILSDGCVCFIKWTPVISLYSNNLNFGRKRRKIAGWL